LFTQLGEEPQTKDFITIAGALKRNLLSRAATSLHFSCEKRGKLHNHLCLSVSALPPVTIAQLLAEIIKRLLQRSAGIDANQMHSLRKI
jgi:hypothetical protein